MDFEDVRQLVLGLPETADWPAISEILERYASRPNQAWEWPLRACRAVGGDESDVAGGAAAILCMTLSIRLVDDMLDEDPNGEHLQAGGGAVAANLSFALQAAAFRILSNTPMDPERRAAVMDSLAQAALTLAYGEELDVRNLPGEDNYWKVTRAKCSSFFGTAMHIGAVLANADPETAEQLRHLGAIAGDAIQVHDDLQDAMEIPANPDWKHGRNNLLFLYALTADHPDRERFKELRSQVDDPAALRTAQQILIRCGAVSYAMYQLSQCYSAIRKIIEETPFADPEPLKSMTIQSALTSKVLKDYLPLMENLG